MDRWCSYCSVEGAASNYQVDWFPSPQQLSRSDPSVPQGPAGSDQSGHRRPENPVKVKIDRNIDISKNWERRATLQSILDEPHAEGESVRSSVNRQKPGIHRSIRRLWVRHLHFRTTLGPRASRDILVMTSPSRNQMGVVDRRDYLEVSNDIMKHRKTRSTYTTKQKS